MGALTIPGRIVKKAKGEMIGRKPEKFMGQAEEVGPKRLKDGGMYAGKRAEGPPEDPGISVDGTKLGLALALLTHSSALNKGENQALGDHKVRHSIEQAEKAKTASESAVASGKTDKQSPAPKAAAGKSDRKDFYAKDAEAPKVAGGKVDLEDRAPKVAAGKTDKQNASAPKDENGKPKSKIRMDFEKAFAAARKAGDDEFEFMGKKYNTRRADGK